MKVMKKTPRELFAAAGRPNSRVQERPGCLRQFGACAVLCALLNAAPLYSQTAGAAFLSVDPSPRSYALGTADAIASSGAQAVGQNPANLGLTTEKYEAFTSYQTLLGGSQYGHVAVALDHPAFL